MSLLNLFDWFIVMSTLVMGISFWMLMWRKTQLEKTKRALIPLPIVVRRK